MTQRFHQRRKRRSWSQVPTHVEQSRLKMRAERRRKHQQCGLQKNGIKWSPIHAETLRYVPAATGHTGPTHYATACISDPQSSFSLFVTDEIMLHIASMTNLQGRRTIADWRDVDTDELRAYVGLLILAGVYHSKN